MTSDDPKTPTIDMSDFMAKCAAREKREAALLPLNKAAVFAALTAAGITALIAPFDGYADGGEIHSAEAKTGEEPAALPDTAVEVRSAAYDSEDITIAALPLAEAVEALCYSLLEAHHDGWEINEGAYGEFAFDVATGVVSLDFNYRVESTEHHTHEF